ncbi:MAG: hypothetical protein ACKO66_09460, partial [Flavobacteriales bacterium]
VDGPVVAGHNTLATVDVGEVTPPVLASIYACAAAWCNEDVDAQNTVWFTFVAPASGAVTITSCTDSTTIDTQLALYSVSNCADYASFVHLASNDDMMQPCGLAGPYSSFIAYDQLTPGATYYVQADGYNGELGIIGVQVNATIPTAEVNIVHNSADAAVATVDIWVGDSLWVNNLNFRTCSGNLLLPADMDLQIAVCPSSSTDPSNPWLVSSVNLNHAHSYYATLSGIASATGYTPAPAMALNWFDGAMLLSDMANTTPTVFFQGVTDGGNWDIVQAQTGNLYNDNIQYAGYSAEGYVYFSPENVTLSLLTENGVALNQDFCLPFLIYAPAGAALHVVSSGFLDPSSNSNGAALGLFIVNPWDGSFIPIDAGACDIPSNDVLCNATQLFVDAPPVSADNTLASVQSGESSPTNLPGSDPESDCVAAWCDGTLDNTLWFQFPAPVTGCVAISTCFNEAIDTQIALCTVGDCNDFSTVTYIALNDDMAGGCSGGNSYASLIQVCDLVPGSVYYIQMDGYEGAVGPFQIQVTSVSAVAEIQEQIAQVYPNPAHQEVSVQLASNA